MKCNTRVSISLLVIIGLTLAQGGVLLATGVRSDGLVEQLRSDIDLILAVSGIIITALVTTIGILWRALRASQSEFIETLKKLKEE